MKTLISSIILVLTFAAFGAPFSASTSTSQPNFDRDSIEVWRANGTVSQGQTVRATNTEYAGKANSTSSGVLGVALSTGTHNKLISVATDGDVNLFKSLEEAGVYVATSNGNYEELDAFMSDANNEYVNIVGVARNTAGLMAVRPLALTNLITQPSGT